jgi:hypothetical protein
MKGMFFPGLAVLLAVGVAAGYARSATVCLEAESAFSNEPPMVVVSMTNAPSGIQAVEGASGNAYLEVPLGAGKTPKVKAGMAKITFEAPADGSYTFWLRVFWAGECSNTFLIQIDSEKPFMVGGDSTFKSWHWIKSPMSKMTPPPFIAKGSHTLTIIHREDGVRLDQLVLASSPRYVPVGVEKAGTHP